MNNLPGGMTPLDEAHINDTCPIENTAANCQAYTIVQREPCGSGEVIALGHSLVAASPWATWVSYEAAPDQYDWGIYFVAEYEARLNMMKRATDRLCLNESI